MQGVSNYSALMLSSFHRPNFLLPFGFYDAEYTTQNTFEPCAECGHVPEIARFVGSQSTNSAVVTLTVVVKTVMVKTVMVKIVTVKTVMIKTMLVKTVTVKTVMIKTMVVKTVMIKTIV